MECPTVPGESWGKTVNRAHNELPLWSNVIQLPYISLIAYLCLSNVWSLD